MQDNLAFEIRGQGNLLLAKGNVLFSDELKKGRNFQSVKEEIISTQLGMGKRSSFSVQRGDMNIKVTVDSYDDLEDCVVMQWSFKNTGKILPWSSFASVRPGFCLFIIV